MDIQKIINILEDLVYEDINNEEYWKAIKDAKALIKELKQALTIPVVMHRCNLVDYGDEEKRCVKCGYITWNNDKTDNEIDEREDIADDEL